MKFRHKIHLIAAPFIMTLVLSAAGTETSANDQRIKDHHALQDPAVVEVTTTDADHQDKLLANHNEAVNHDAIIDHDMLGEDKGTDALVEEHDMHHPEVKLFGKSLDAIAQFGVTVFNFLIFAGILFFLLKGALASAFKNHRKELTDKLLSAEQSKEEAERQIQELEVKMVELQKDLDVIIVKAEADAKVEQNGIIEAAKAEANQILSQARSDIERLKRSAEVELHAMVVELVAESAAKRVKNQLYGDVASSVLDQAIEKVRGNQ
jgi:F-type H+-transporting ATPase subunit b